MPKLKSVMRVVAFVVIGIPLFVVVAFISKLKWDDYFYARDLFSSDDINISRVIGSKRWHSSSDDIFACSFAIVELKPESTAALMASISMPVEGSSSLSYKSDEHGQGAYGQFNIRDWPTTPISRERFNRMCEEIPRECCLTELKAADAAIIMKGLDTPGGWAARGSEVTSFFLPEQNIIGTIRFGD